MLVAADQRASVESAQAEVKKAKEDIERAEALLEKGTKGPSILERAKDKVKDLFSSEKAPEPSPEDTSILEKLRQYFRPEPDLAAQAKELGKESAESILQKIRSLFGAGENAAEKARQAAASSDTGAKAGEAAESTLEKLRHLFQAGERQTEASKPSVKGAATYVGTKAGEAAESLADKVKSALGYAKEGAASTEASLHESTLDKIKSMLGMSPPSTTERIKEGIKSGAESMAEKVKHGLGMEEDTLVDKVKQAMGLEPTLGQKVKHALGLEPTLGEKIKDAMGMGQESTMDKVKHAMGIDTEPSTGDKVRHALGMDKEEPSLGTRIKHAMGIETEQPSIGDRVRHTLGLDKEEPSLGEKIKEGVKHAMGVDTSLTDKATSALGIHKPTVLERLRNYFGVHQPTTAEKMKESLDTSIAQARRAIEDRIDALRKATTGSARQSAYDDLVKALKTAREDLTNRADTLYDAMSHTVKQAAQGVADKISGTETEDTRGLLTRARDDMSGRINSLYETIASTSRSWADDFNALGERVKGAFRRDSSYLLQGSQYDNGITSFYVNDNGHEYLDVTGQNIDPNKYDKLKALNNFRSQYKLHAYKEFPSNVTIQTHPIKRTHVLIKSSRVIDGNQFDYVYDDGEEYLDVNWAGEAPKVFSKDMQTRIIDSFRQTHGLIPSAASLPRVRATIAHKSEKKDEL